jgi:hypothetical protein
MSEQEFSPFTIVSNKDGLNTRAITDNMLFATAVDFSHFIESHALETDKTCTDVILEYCDARDIDPEEISKLVNMSLKGKLMAEMIESGLLSESGTLEDFE